ncbi:hypothetical protein [Flavobacterium hungaricum]|nr:hypothetical protein [Flavobacterium hungaricum]
MSQDGFFLSRNPFLEEDWNLDREAKTNNDAEELLLFYHWN